MPLQAAVSIVNRELAVSLPSAHLALGTFDDAVFEREPLHSISQRFLGLTPCYVMLGRRRIAIAYLPSYEHDAEAIVLLVDDIQDELVTRIGAAWPRCPDHEHPLEAALVDGDAVWKCPSEGFIVRRIGDGQE